MIVRVDTQMGGWRVRMTKRAHQTAFRGEMDEARVAARQAGELSIWKKSFKVISP